MDQQVPNFVFHEDTSPVVEQVPSHKIKVLFARGFFDRQCKVSTTLGGAVIAQTLRRGNLVPLGGLAVDGLCWRQYRIDDRRTHGWYFLKSRAA